MFIAAADGVPATVIVRVQNGRGYLEHGGACSRGSSNSSVCVESKKKYMYL